MHKYSQILLTAAPSPFTPLYSTDIGNCPGPCAGPGFVELHDVHIDSLIKPVKVHLEGITSLKFTKIHKKAISMEHTINSHTINSLPSLFCASLPVRHNFLNPNSAKTSHWSSSHLLPSPGIHGPPN